MDIAEKIGRTIGAARKRLIDIGLKKRKPKA
jgi:hypothetical protein